MLSAARTTPTIHRSKVASSGAPGGADGGSICRWSSAQASSRRVGAHTGTLRCTSGSWQSRTQNIEGCHDSDDGPSFPSLSEISVASTRQLRPLLVCYPPSVRLPNGSSVFADVRPTISLGGSTSRGCSSYAAGSVEHAVYTSTQRNAPPAQSQADLKLLQLLLARRGGLRPASVRGRLLSKSTLRFAAPGSRRRRWPQPRPLSAFAAA